MCEYRPGGAGGCPTREGRLLESATEEGRGGTARGGGEDRYASERVARTEPVRAEHPEHRHHRSRRELRARVDALERQRFALLLGFVACVCLALFLVFSRQRISSELSEVQTKLAEERAASEKLLDETRTELVKTRKALKTAHAGIAGLVDKRIPGLQELELDKTIEVDAGILRNMTLTRSPGSEQGSHELKAVLQNDSPLSVSPALRILLFDDLGVQVGRIQIGPEADGKPLSLRPGEIRSYFAPVEIEPQGTARYFRVEPLKD